MSEENAERLGLNRERCLDNYRKIAANPEIAQKLVALYDIEEEHDEQDIDHALYSGGFLSEEDRRWCEQVIESRPENLIAIADNTQHQGLRALLFRYRARNFPNTLTADEMTRWQRHRHARLTDASSNGSITLDTYLVKLEQLAHEYSDNPDKQAILRALYQYAENL